MDDSRTISLNPAAEDDEPPAVPRTTASAGNDESQTANPGRRKRLITVFVIIVAVLTIGYGLYDWLIGSQYVSTDNAYVGADNAQITPLVGGQVIEVPVSDTQSVKRGQILLRIDDADEKIAVAQAQGDLALAERRYGQTSATGDALQAMVLSRQAEIGRARAQLTVAEGDLQRSQVDYDRRKALVASGAVSGDELTSSANALHTAQANMALARAAIIQAEATRESAEQDRAANSQLTRGTTIATAPEVVTARAKLDQAELDLKRTVVLSPIDGVVSERKVQIGQRLSAGTTAMTVVPIDQLYVDANFKEGQLRNVRPGQAVTLQSDLYGGGIVYHGHVVGFSGGTGSAFALIPAQNATGNWIKIVQRLPVRIALDPVELREHPLRVGLSMEAEVDLSVVR